MIIKMSGNRKLRGESDQDLSDCLSVLWTIDRTDPVLVVCQRPDPGLSRHEVGRGGRSHHDLVHWN